MGLFILDIFSGDVLEETKNPPETLASTPVESFECPTPQLEEYSPTSDVNTEDEINIINSILGN